MTMYFLLVFFVGFFLFFVVAGANNKICENWKWSYMISEQMGTQVPCSNQIMKKKKVFKYLFSLMFYITHKTRIIHQFFYLTSWSLQVARIYINTINEFCCAIVTLWSLDLIWNEKNNRALEIYKNVIGSFLNNFMIFIATLKNQNFLLILKI